MEHVKGKEIPTVLLHLDGKQQADVTSLRWTDLDG